MNNNSRNKGIAELSEFVTENQERITNATLSAMSRVENTAEAMTDLDAKGREAVKQRLEAIIFATPTILPSYVGEAFETEFSEISDVLRNSLIRNTATIVTENRQEWLNLMIQKFEHDNRDNE